MKHHVDLAAMAGERFIDRVVDHFLRQMIGAGGVGIHTRTLANGLQPSEHLNGVSVVFRHAVLELPINRCGSASRLSPARWPVCRDVRAYTQSA